jgi:hypothetical protein
VLLDPHHELVSRGNAARNAERRRLDHGQRAQEVRVPRRRE